MFGFEKAAISFRAHVVGRHWRAAAVRRGRLRGLQERRCARPPRLRFAAQPMESLGNVGSDHYFGNSSMRRSFAHVGRICLRPISSVWYGYMLDQAWSLTLPSKMPIDNRLRCPALTTIGGGVDVQHGPERGYRAPICRQQQWTRTPIRLLRRGARSTARRARKGHRKEFR